jgi:hypothetical protein
MRYWFDCEFLEAGGESPVHLLSLGMVAEDGRELYFVNRDCPVREANEWVRANVLPKIDFKQAVSRSECRARLLAFVGNDPAPEFWAYVGAYDWVCLAGLLGRMVDLPVGWPKYALDVKQVWHLMGRPTLPPKPPESEAHNALADARWTKTAWQFLSLVAADMGAGRVSTPSG